jgi:putative Holliday junction resolvase
MALLGVDLGERRIGLAVAEGEPARAVPLATLPRRASVAADVADLTRIVTERGIVELVVGLPIEASGIEGPQARSTRAWADEVGRLLALPLAYRDERLTSHLAEGRVGAAKRGRSGGPPTPAQRRERRERVDREAATIILQDELDARTLDRERARGSAHGSAHDSARDGAALPQRHGDSGR